MKLSFVTRHSRCPNQNHCPQWGALPGVPSLERCVIDLKNCIIPIEAIFYFFLDWFRDFCLVSVRGPRTWVTIWIQGHTYPGKRIFKKQMQTKKKKKKRNLVVVWCLSACEGNLSTFVSLSGTNGLSRTESLETSCDERDSQSGRAAKRHSLGFAEWEKKKKMKIIISTACPNQLGRSLKDIFILWRSFLTSLAWKIRAGNSRRGLKKKKKNQWNDKRSESGSWHLSNLLLTSHLSFVFFDAEQKWKLIPKEGGAHLQGEGGSGGDLWPQCILGYIQCVNFSCQTGLQKM